MRPSSVVIACGWTQVTLPPGGSVLDVTVVETTTESSHSPRPLSHNLMEDTFDCYVV